LEHLRAARGCAWIGLFMVATQAGRLRRLVGWVGEVRLLVIGFALMAVGIAAVAWVPSYPWFFAIGPIIAIGNGLGFPSFTSLFTKACRADAAGRGRGRTQTLAGGGGR